jgi:hypothetical protein
VPVKSRLLVGVGAWLLGAAAATSGSMIAVNQLAHGLLGPQTQQLAEASISVNPDDAADRPSPSTAATPGRPSPSAATRRHRQNPSAANRRDRDASGTRSGVDVAPSASVTPSASQTAAGTVLQSPYGQVTAECQSAGAYLMYWSAALGYQADDVFRGPAAVASINFEARANEVVMKVSCKAGKPVARLSHDN